MKNILIIDDDIFIRESLSQLLGEKYTIFQSIGHQDTMAILNSTKIDLCLLDVNLYNCNGFDLCRDVRKRFLMPVIFITVEDNEESLSQGIISGGDDYITKPFSFRELDLRIMAHLRRAEYLSKKETAFIICGVYTLDIKNQTLFKNSTEVVITKTEFKIIRLLMANAGCLVTREILLHDLWDIKEQYVDSNTLTVNISRIRKKLSIEDGVCPIQTVHGIGYRWEGR